MRLNIGEFDYGQDTELAIAARMYDAYNPNTIISGGKIKRTPGLIRGRQASILRTKRYPSQNENTCLDNFDIWQRLCIRKLRRHFEISTHFFRKFYMYRWPEPSHYECSLEDLRGP